MKQSSTNIILIDDHEMVRRGLRALLHLEPDMVIIGEAGTVAAGVSLVERLVPHMVLLDVKLPDASVTEACRRLLAVVPTLRILILTSYAEDSTVMAAVQHGAHGYVLKDVRMDDLIRAIRTVAGGQGYLDPRVTQQALHWIRTSSHLGETSNGTSRLSPQERLILPLLAEGKTNKEIAVHLRLSDKTVKNYLANIFDKLHVKRRTEAVAWFMKETHVPSVTGTSFRPSLLK
jgi:two-component system response regulator DevR